MALSVSHAHIAAAGHVTGTISSTLTSQTRWLEAQTASNVQSRLSAIWKSSCKLCDSKQSLWTAVGVLPHSRTLWLRGSDTANRPTNSTTSFIKPATCASATQHLTDPSEEGKKRKDYAFRCQLSEKPSTILGCPGFCSITYSQ